MYTELLGQHIKKNGFIRYWDDEAKAPYLFDGGTFITYHDEEALHAQCISKGSLFWEYSRDRTGALLNSLHQSLL